MINRIEQYNYELRIKNYGGKFVIASGAKQSDQNGYSEAKTPVCVQRTGRKNLFQTFGKNITFLIIILGLFLHKPALADNLQPIINNYHLSSAEAGEITKAYQGALKVGIKENDALIIIRNSLKNELTAKQIIRILTLISKTNQAKLPVEPLINKIKEGLAKNAEPAQLVEVAEKKALHISKANDILNKVVLKNFSIDKPELMIIMLSDYLDQGVSEEKIIDILMKNKGQKVTVDQIRDMLSKG